jgi:Zn-dependent membrane protease YugP
MGFGLVIGLIFFAISWMVGSRLKSKFKEYSQTPLQSNLSGQEIAVKMLRDHGIFDVSVICVEGQLTDHYNPVDKTVNLSKEVFYGRNAAAAAVAAHECGHAVQHATAYSMLKFRSAMVPVQNVSATVLNWVIMISMFGGVFLTGGAGLQIILPILVLCNLVITLFALVTLPVEFDASRRALQWISSKGVVTSSEHALSKDALWWAAMTYVVAALGAIANLAYYLFLMFGRRDG